MNTLTAQHKTTFHGAVSHRATGGIELARHEGVSLGGDWAADLKPSRASSLPRGSVVFW